MAAAERVRTGAVQHTGNPVFDTMANMVMNFGATWQVDQLAALHDELLKLYEKEPNRVAQKKQNAINAGRS